eukprot:CAMPEP_0179260982 /NCGR_PEP_ID=MMETSP0797-20121207/26621_1 /TAXON_ID=47934 /ORGANISM="Dinophysis acuminata, Strain DAEP01" /LENGTH=137 /DNA_ID=CAMNT_0020969081 /DNA_START=114 /DNA_END=529 /DNA_ORIENTATION=+
MTAAAHRDGYPLYEGARVSAGTCLVERLLVRPHNANKGGCSLHEGTRVARGPVPGQFPAPVLLHQVQRPVQSLQVVVGDSVAAIQLLPSEDEPLLVDRDTLHGLDLGLDRVDRVGALDSHVDGPAIHNLHHDRCATS